MAAMPLTAHLRALHPTYLDSATTHPFLTHAGRGTLSSAPLCRWLVQDKYYQFAYVNFMGRLISKVNLSSYAFPAKGENSLEWQTLTTLMSALHAVKIEIEFYNDTVEKYGLELERDGEDETTRRYRELFEESSAPGRPMVEGLVVLWGTEFCYLKAWSHAKDQKTSSTSIPDDNGAAAALHKEFIPNWTSDDFRAAVDTIASVVNSCGEGLEKEELAKCEKLWLRVLELEAKFWPTV